jgi:uncharacterized membrane protein HdeD (DUF308 family)
MAPLEIKGSQRNWRRFVELGVTSIILGGIALSTILSSSAVSTALIGWLLVLSGIAETVHAFRIHRPDGFLFHLIPGVAAVPVGLLAAAQPAAGAITWTLVFATFFTVVGLFRTISAFYLKFPNWGWTVFDGVVMLVLGTVMWAAWVWLLPRFLSFAVGVSLILRGWASITFAQGLRRLNRQRREERRHEPERKPAKGFVPKAELKQFSK